MAGSTSRRAIVAGIGVGAMVLGACNPEQSGDATPVNPVVAGFEDELVVLRNERLDRPDRLSSTTELGGTGFAIPNRGGSNALVEEAVEALDPGADWKGERLGLLAGRLLERITAAAEPDAIPTLLADRFRCGSLRPERFEDVFDDGRLVVRRGRVGEDSRDGLDGAGAAGLINALHPLGVISKVKVVGVEWTDGAVDFATRVLVEAGDGARQVNAEWECRWEGIETPRLAGIRVVRHDEVLRADADSAPFVDATGDVLGKSAHFEAQVMHGIEYWAQRIPKIGDLALTGHHGIAVGDVNGDGRDDLFVCDGGSLPNRLYVQRPDGTADEVSAEAGVDQLEDSRGALLVDLDNDGDQDLVVATIAMIAFAENDGTGRFTLRGGHPGAPSPFSLSAADYDLDGDLDVYACVYGAGDDQVSGTRGFEARSPIPFEDAENGGRNVLLENLGSFRFADATERSGLDANNRRWSFAASWEDYDRDGDPDLYVANDFGRNCLYRNDAAPPGARGRRFVDVAGQAGVEDMAAGMSVSWGDYDRNGRPDLHVGNMFSSAGRRVGYQRAFAPGREDAALAGLRRMARGNTLFAAAPDSGAAPSFLDVSEAAGITMGRWAWSSGFVDLNNDGWEDIVIANGYLTNTRDDDL